ncbi:MAG TPA: hypothetical protein VGK06_15455 [Methanosarcina sp.]
MNFSEIYEKIYKTMGELQPIAFLFSASLVVSGLYTTSEKLQINHVYTLLAAPCFFFAYASFMGFRLTNFKWFFMIGAASLAYALYFIFRAVIGLVLLALDLNDALPPLQKSTNIDVVLFLIITSFIVVITVFSVIKLKNTKLSKYIIFDKVIKSVFYLFYVIILIIVINQNTIQYMIGFALIGVLFVDISILVTLFIKSTLPTKETDLEERGLESEYIIKKYSLIHNLSSFFELLRKKSK